MPDVYETQVSVKVVGDKSSIKTFQSEVEKSVSRIKAGISEVKGGAGMISGGLSSFASGITKGSFGTGGGGTGITGALGKMIGQFGVMLGVAQVIQRGISKISNFLAEASPAWAATRQLFKRAFMLFFKPFGDALATLFRPMAMGMLKLSLDWNRWFLTSEQHALNLEDILKNPIPTMTIGGQEIVGGLNMEQWTKFADDANTVSEFKWENVQGWATYVQSAFNDWQMHWDNWRIGVVPWLQEKIWTPMQDSLSELGDWFSKLGMQGGLYFKQIEVAFGTWADSFKSWWSSGWDSIKSTLTGWWDSLKGAVSGAFSSVTAYTKRYSFQAGGEVYNTGLAMVHRGEKVLTPADRNRESEGGSQMNNFSINANISSSYDVKRLAEDLNKYMHEEHRKRVSYGVY